MAAHVLEYMLTGKEAKKPGPFLKKMRVHQNLSSAEVAKTLKMDTEELNKIESGREIPGFFTILAYLKAIKFSVLAVSRDDAA